MSETSLGLVDVKCIKAFSTNSIENCLICGLRIIGSRPSDHYFRSVCWFVCLLVCAEFFSAVFDPISIKLGHMLYVWV